MRDKKSMLPKRAGALKKKPRKKPSARAIVFHYERGVERVVRTRFRSIATTPRRPENAELPRASRTMRELAHAHLGHETILLVEDDEAVRDTVGHELVALGYTVIEACNGPEALRVAEREPARRIDLLLTDVMMPEMDGCALAARLRERQPKLKVLFSNAYQLAQRQQNRLIPFHPNRLCGTLAWALFPKMTANELPSKTKEKQRKKNSSRMIL
jgi:CheY-like chemotaxis protein